MKFNQAINNSAFDVKQQRERHCAQWLKSLHHSVSRHISWAVVTGCANGLLIIVQVSLLSFMLQQLMMEHRDWQALLKPCVGFLLVILLRGLCLYASQVTGFEGAVRIKRQLRTQLLDHLAKLGPAFVKQQHTGQLATVALEQCEALENYFSRYVPQKSIAVFVPMLILLVVFPINWVVGLIFLFTGPLVPLFMALIGLGAAAANRERFQEMAWMGGYFLDRIQGLTTLKLFGQADHESRSIAFIADQFRIQTMRVLRIAFLSSAVLEFFAAVAVALVAVYVGLGLLGLIRFGPATDITLGEALFVLLLAPEFFQPLRQLAVNYHDRAMALGAADAILQVLEEDVVRNDRVEYRDSGYCIELRDVCKGYHDRIVLKQLDLHIKTGEKVALTGKSGAGKSTLLNLLLGFEEPDAGQVLIDGRTVTRETVAQQIGWLDQRAAIFYASIADNICLYDPDRAPEQVNAAACAAGVMSFADQLADGLDTLIGEQGYGLSGGQVQRVALARVLLKDAPIVLLDEPTANLDRQTKRQLLDSIEQLFRDKTVLIASHDPEVFDRMDRRLHLAGGNLR